MSTEEKAPIEHTDDDLFGVDVHVEDPAFGSLHPIIQWVNGDPTRKTSKGIDYTGGFFCSTDQGIEIPGAESFTLITREAEEIEGFSIASLKIFPIRYRRSWMAVKEEGGLSVRFPAPLYDDAKEYDYRGSPRSRGQLLCLIEGMDEPVVLTFAGINAGRVFSQGNDRGVIPDFGQNIINRARSLASRAGRDISYPLCAFKLEIGSGTDDKGKPVFTKVGKGDRTSNVTHPMWLDKPSGIASESHIRGLFSGRQLFGKLEDMHRNADEWIKQWAPEVLIENIKRMSSTRTALAGVMGGNTADGGGNGVPGDREVPF